MIISPICGQNRRMDPQKKNCFRNGTAGRFAAGIEKALLVTTSIPEPRMTFVLTAERTLSLPRNDQQTEPTVQRVFPIVT